MEKTTFEFVQMDRDLPMRVLHFSENNPLIYSQIKEMITAESSVSFVPMHWHKELEVTFVVKGDLSLRKNQETKNYQDGTFFIVNSGEIHELKGEFSPGFDIICFIISYDFVKNYLPGIDSLVFDLEKTKTTYPKLEKIFLSILADHQSKEPFSYLRIQSELLALFHILCTHHLVDSEEEINIAISNQLNQEILDYIHAHYNEKLSLEDVSSHFNFSREHFSRLFKDNFGRTFLTYLTDYRLYRAFPEIIKGNNTLELISQRHGFPSSKALIRHFKQVYHDTPIQYRKKYNIRIMDHNDQLM